MAQVTEDVKLVEVHLVNKSVQQKVLTIINENALTTKKMASINTEGLSTDKHVLDILALLRVKAQLMAEKPLMNIKLKKLFRITEVKNQTLVYRQGRGDGMDGFFHALDPISKIQRSKRKVEEGKGEEARMKEILKYGQVAAVPNEWTWSFSWTNIKHPKLEKYISGTTQKFMFRHPLKEEMKELVNHLAAELFVYFRKGIPNYYLNKMLDKLIIDFPVFSDSSTCTGYTWLRPLVSNAFRTLTELGCPRKKRAKSTTKINREVTTLRLIEDLVSVDVYMEIVRGNLDKDPVILEALNKQKSVVPLDQASLRFDKFVVNLISFFSKYKQNRRTTFYQMYPSMKYSLEGEEPLLKEQIALHILHLSFNASDLIVEYSEIGKGIYFRLKEGCNIDMMPDGVALFGSILIDHHVIIEHSTITKGVFLISALYCILGINHPVSLSHFLTFIEKEMLGIHRLIHTPLTTQLKKVLNRNAKQKTQSSAVEETEE